MPLRAVFAAPLNRSMSSEPVKKNRIVLNSALEGMVMKDEATDF